MAINVILMAVLIAQYNAEYYRDFRSQVFDNAELRLVGTDGTLMVKPEPGGLRITIPQQQNELRPVGFVPQFRVRGDFEITTTYEILGYDRPTSGHGVGVSLYVSMDSSTNEAAHLARSVMVGGAQVIATTRMSTVGGQRKVLRRKNFPIITMGGKLRCTRIGSMLHYSMAELESDIFRELHQDELGTGDLTMVRVAAENGSSTHAVDVRFLDFRIRAEELPGPSSAQPPSGSHLIEWIVGILLGLGILGGVVYWRASRAG